MHPYRFYYLPDLRSLLKIKTLTIPVNVETGGESKHPLVAESQPASLPLLDGDLLRFGEIDWIVKRIWYLTLQRSC